MKEISPTLYQLTDIIELFTLKLKIVMEVLSYIMTILVRQHIAIIIIITIIHIISTATFDIQDLLAVVNDDGDIIVTGELITNSHAKGCFIVLQGSHNTADIYQVLSRSVSGTIIAPSSNYTVYGYDIEDNALPNSLPAVVIETIVNINNSKK